MECFSEKQQLTTFHEAFCVLNSKCFLKGFTRRRELGERVRTDRSDASQRKELRDERVVAHTHTSILFNVVINTEVTCFSLGKGSDEKPLWKECTGWRLLRHCKVSVRLHCDIGLFIPLISSCERGSSHPNLYQHC